MKEWLLNKFMTHTYRCSMYAPFVTRHTSRRQSNSCHTMLSKSGVMVATASVILFFKSGMLTGCGGTNPKGSTGLKRGTVQARPWPARFPDLTPCDYFLWG